MRVRRGDANTVLGAVHRLKATWRAKRVVTICELCRLQSDWEVSMMRLLRGWTALVLAVGLGAMSAWGAGGPDPDAKDTKDKKEAVPELQRFDPAQVDKSLDPCTDFF